jgi:purine nucleosidase
VSQNRLVLDTDGGVDDAQALLLLIANGRPPAAITTVFGNVGVEAATANMLATLAIAGTDIPVHVGASRGLIQPLIDAKHVHGEDGLGGAPRPEKVASPASHDAVGFLRDAFREAASKSEKVDILMIGPLTNLALALKLEPDIIAGIGKLTIMGGTIHGRGNVTATAEFNIFCDPEAASIVFDAGIETVVVPWEPCVQHYLTGDEVNALFARVPDSLLKTFSETLAKHARQAVAGFGGGDAFRFVDPFAAAVLLRPDIVTKSTKAAVRVVLDQGIARGMTVIDPRGRLGAPDVTLIEAADKDQLTALYAASIAFKPAITNN